MVTDAAEGSTGLNVEAAAAGVVAAGGGGGATAAAGAGAVERISKEMEKNASDFIIFLLFPSHLQRRRARPERNHPECKKKYER